LLARSARPAPMPVPDVGLGVVGVVDRPGPDSTSSGPGSGRHRYSTVGSRSSSDVPHEPANATLGQDPVPDLVAQRAAARMSTARATSHEAAAAHVSMVRTPSSPLEREVD